jgi:DNA-binding MarR family transcriptional regulator
LRPRPLGPSARAAPAIDRAREFLQLLWRIEHALNTTSKRMTVELGLTDPQRLVLGLVGRFPGLTPGRLARLLHVHPSTLTGVLRRLERRGWLDRRTDPRDARRVRLGLTPRGRALDPGAPGTVETAALRTLAREPTGRIRAVRDLLARFADELETAEGEP